MKKQKFVLRIILSITLLIGIIIGLYYFGTIFRSPHCNITEYDGFGGASTVICNNLGVLMEKIMIFFVGFSTVFVAIGVLLLLVGFLVGLWFVCWELIKFIVKIFE